MVFSASIMWQTRDVLHRKNSQVVPGVLLLMSGSLVAYRHATMDDEDSQQDPLKTFLGLIVIQMIPLVILEMKIMSCHDPVAMFCKFAGPVTLMHALFLGMRVCVYNINPLGDYWLNIGALMGAFITMHFGFHQRWNFRSIFVEYSAVWHLALLTVAAACITEVMAHWDVFMHHTLWQALQSVKLQVISNATNYIELMAFIPAVWMVCRDDQNAQRVDVESPEIKRKATAFFVFLFTFYCWEDIVQALEAASGSRLASAAHLLHFLLLVDFAFYVLAHVYNPDKLVGELQKWLPADFRCAV